MHIAQATVGRFILLRTCWYVLTEGDSKSTAVHISGGKRQMK